MTAGSTLSAIPIPSPSRWTEPAQFDVYASFQDGLARSPDPVMSLNYSQLLGNYRGENGSIWARDGSFLLVRC
jgi:hypothetical protein